MRVCAFEGCAFVLKPSNKAGYCQEHYSHSPREAARKRAYSHEHRHKTYARRTELKAGWDCTFRKYGITAQEYAALNETQKGRCAICGGPPILPTKRLSVDHCHRTGRVRGLLCTNCNVGIGNLKDDPKLVLRAAEYLSEEQLNQPAQDSDSG